MQSGDRVLNNITLEMGIVVSVTDDDVMLVEVDGFGDKNWLISDCELIAGYELLPIFVPVRVRESD